MEGIFAVKSRNTAFFSAPVSVGGVRLTDVLSDDISEYTVFPGFCDVHVHFREPGFSYKETIFSGSRAGARGGYTAVCTMPNLNPTPDCLENLKLQTDIIKKDACIKVFPYGTISMGRKGLQLSDMKALSSQVIAFSDDGSGVQDSGVMREAMLRAKALNKIIAAHCEDNSLLEGGCIHAGEYAKSHGYKGISSESEYKQLERDLLLAEETGCAYHVCHISTAESVSLISQAKKAGIDVSCETAPHYLTLDDSCLKEDGRFKMNPPLRSKKDRQALIEGVIDGTIDMLATDHAPHSHEEKSRGLRDSAFGISGLECAFPVLYTELVRGKIISLERLVELMAFAPRKRFDIALEDEFAIWALERPCRVDTDTWLSKGKASPYSGRPVYGECVLTLCNGNIVWQK